MAKTMLCHCEEITELEVRRAIRAGYRDLESLKRYLAAGTGVCQARSCLVALVRVIQEETGTSLEGAAPLVSRPPLGLTPLGAFCSLGDEESGDAG